MTHSICLALMSLASMAQPPVLATEAVPPNVAVLELDLADVATAQLDDVDIGTKRQFRFETLGQEKWATHKLVCTFTGGQREERTVLLKGGWRVRLNIRPGASHLPEIELQKGHSEMMVAVAISPDGRYAATASFDQTAILWDLATGRQLRTYRGHINKVLTVRFSHDGKRLITGSMDATARIWDVATGATVRRFEGHRGPIWSVAFSPDDKRIVTSAEDSTARLWDAANGDVLRTFATGAKFDDGDSTAIAFAPDGRKVLAAIVDGTAVLFEAASGAKQLTLAGHTSPVRTIAFSPDGSKILTGSDDQTAILWNAADGKPISKIAGHSDIIISVAFSTDGKRFLTASMDGTVILHDTVKMETIRKWKGEKIRLWQAAWSADGKTIVGACEDGAAIVWDADTALVRHRLRGGAAPVLSLAVDPDGRRLLLGSEDGAATLWDLTTGRPSNSLKGHTDRVSVVTFVARGERALTASLDGTFGFWETGSGRRLRVFKGHPLIYAAALDPGESRILTGSLDKTARLWDADGVELRNFGEHSERVVNVAFHPKDRLAATSTIYDTFVWDLADDTRKSIKFSGSTGTFSPDGKFLLTAQSYREKYAVTLWALGDGKAAKTFRGHRAIAQAASFSVDQRLLLTGSLDNTAILWDVETARSLRVFRGHTHAVWGTALIADGRCVLTSSADGTTRLWDIATGDELARIVVLNRGQDWLVTTADGLFDGSPGGREKVAYRVGGALTLVPVDRFFQDFYRPGLLAALLQGQRPRADVQLGVQQAPAVKILAPKQGEMNDSGEVTIEAEVANKGGGISGPWLIHNGTRVRAAGKTEKRGDAVRRNFEVTLAPGNNKIEVRAASADGSWESEPAVLTLKYQRAPEKVTLHLLSVGISKYGDSSLNLKFAAADARALASLFEKRGRALFRDVKLAVLLDADATQEKIRAAARQFAGAAQPQDVLVVLLAGHGASVGQRYYFVPHDFKRSNAPTMEEDIRKQGLPGDVLASWLEEVKATKRVVIFDTCHSGAALGLKRGSRDPFAFQGAIETLRRSSGAHTLAAAAAGEEALEVDELGHGVLTYALLAGLRAVDGGPLGDRAINPTNPEGVVDVFEWFSYASGNVPRLTEKYFKARQNVSINSADNIFPLLPLAEK